MQLKCEQCGAPFRGSDLHLNRGLATCGACGGVQRLPGPTAVPVDGDWKPSQPLKPQGDMPIPARFVVEESGHELLIRHRWFQWGLVFLLFFAIAWDSFLFGWYSMFFGVGGEPPGMFGVVFLLFPLAHVAVGVGLTYGVLAGFLNSTDIRVADGMLTVRHGPLPWLGNVDSDAKSISQIYCQRKISTNSSDDGSSSTSTRYEVHAVVGDRKVKLLGGLQDADHALFVEQRLERFLKIEDQPILGEMSS